MRAHRKGDTGATRRPRPPSVGRDAGYGARERGAHWLGAGTTVPALLIPPFHSSIPPVPLPSRSRVRLVPSIYPDCRTGRRRHRVTAAFASTRKFSPDRHQHCHRREVAPEGSDRIDMARAKTSVFGKRCCYCIVAQRSGALYISRVRISGPSI